ncbi:MAG: hypothetical protein CMJ59_02490 [Planctomycetaceae bacterium]|nr:hypothetical protein [Planctomycetaceae bacterium]
MATDTDVRRKTQSDVAFDEGLDEAAIDELVSASAFETLDPEYRQSARFRATLKAHARVVDVQPGDLVVREGDWGNSAFFILSGKIAVEIEPPESGMPQEMLGRRRDRPKSLLQALAQLFTNHRFPEFRGRFSFAGSKSDVQRRGAGNATRIFLQDLDGVLDKYAHAFLEPGQFFGEIAALGRTRRTATLFAVETSRLIEIRWQGLRDIMRRDAGIQALIDKRFRERSLRAFLEASPMFEHLREDADGALKELADGVELRVFGEYGRAQSFRELADAATAGDFSGEHLIAREGDYPNGIVMIRGGLARVSHQFHHGERTASYLGPGQEFGFNEIMAGHGSSQPVALQHSLRALGFLMAVVVPTPLVEKYILNHPASAWYGAAQRAEPNRSSDAHQRVDQDLIEFLVGNRFVNGTATMLINMDRCTRCDDCVRACAASHDNNPRFLRNGPINNGIMVANACMHCRDPICMIECPTGAISRKLDEGEVAINDGTCIGCGTCSNNCPYDAIRMVEIRDRNGRFLRDRTVASRAPITKATKCDLCVEQKGGPACQRACPHDAMIRLDMSDVETLVQWHNQ